MTIQSCSKGCAVHRVNGMQLACRFCLSALDKTAWPFELDRFLSEMDAAAPPSRAPLKFVDRTFKLNVSSRRRILQYFLERLSDDLFLHFELIRDRLPDGLKESLAQFPPGYRQLEVGAQSFNPDVQALITRKQDNARTAA
jgi:hypothetical protein